MHDARTAPKLSVVIPLYCEGNHFQASFQEIKKAVLETGLPHEFVLVDDGSNDATWLVVRTLAKEEPALRAVRFSRNFGKEAALRAGLEHATGDVVIVMDGDLQHPPELIPEMVRLWRGESFEIVDAVKADRGRESMVYAYFSKAFYTMLNLLSGYNVKNSSDYKLLDRKVVNALLSMEESCTFFRGMTEWLGFRHGTVAMNVRERAAGTTSWSTLRLIRLALVAVTSFSTSALHIVTFLGVVFLFFAALLFMYTAFYWVIGRALPGFSTVILLQLIIGGCTMMGLGIIGEYMTNMYWEMKRRPRYLVSETLGNAPSTPPEQ